MRADVAWQHQGAGAVPARHAWRGGPDRADPVTADHYVGAGPLDRIEAEHDGAAAERQGAHRRRASLGTAAAAAAESFIGSLVRYRPSKACSAPATALAVGTSPISPIPFAP